MKIKRNKKCKECPQNKREDIVWNKGFQDGLEVGLSKGKCPPHRYQIAHVEEYGTSPGCNNGEARSVVLFCKRCGETKSDFV